MFQQKVYNGLIVGSLLTSLSNAATANGFALNEQSISSAARAFAGRASVAEDASTIYANPAGMSNLPGVQFSTAVSTIIGRARITDATSSIGLPNQQNLAIQGSNQGNMVPALFIPATYLSYQVNAKWHVGVGFYIPQGVVTKYEDGFMGRYHGNNSKVEVLTLQPTVSYRLTDSTALGLGLKINHIKGELETKVFTGTPIDGEVKLNGSDNAVGINFGILSNLTDKTRVGLTYHSPVSYKLTGNIHADVPSKFSQDGSAQIKVTTPAIIDLAVSHAFTPNLTAHANVIYTGWKRFKRIQPEFNEPLFISMQDSMIEEMQWKNTLSYGVAVDYKINSKWTVKSGLAYFATPVPDKRRNVRIPVNDRLVFGLGANYRINASLSIDFAYDYMRDKMAKINQPAIAKKPSYSANYHSTIHVLGLQINYKF